MPKKKNRASTDSFDVENLQDLDFTAIDADLEAMEDHLFKTGVAILQSAKTQEELFSTSIAAIQEALEPDSIAGKETLQLLSSDFSEQPSQEITLPVIWERLNRIEERLEYLINHLIPDSDPPVEITVQSPQNHLIPVTKTHEKWTEKTLKKHYKTLAAIRAELGITAKTWKLAVTEANALMS